MKWTAKQMMAVALARQIEDEKAYIIGTGLPLIGATLAKNTHAPNASLIFETALFEGNPQELPTSVSDLRINYQASALLPQYRYFGFQSIYAKRGIIAAGFLGGAQIDPFGNLNSTCIGNYHNPKTRFTGSGGANGIATYCNTIITMKHEIRRFIPKVDYITSPGWIDGIGGREKLGLPGDKGPRAVVSELGVMKFDDNKRMFLAEYFPGVTPKEVQANTGFPIDVSQAIQSSPPEDEVIRILVEKIDPLGILI